MDYWEDDSSAPSSTCASSTLMPPQTVDASSQHKIQKSGHMSDASMRSNTLHSPPWSSLPLGRWQGRLPLLQEACIPSSSKKGPDLQLHNHMAQMSALFFTPPLGHPVHQRCSLLKRPARSQPDPLRCHHAGGSRVRVSLTYTKSVLFPYPFYSCSASQVMMHLMSSLP